MPPYPPPLLMPKQTRYIGIAGVSSHPDQYPDTPVGYGRFDITSGDTKFEEAGSIDQDPNSTDTLAEYGALVRTLEWAYQNPTPEDVTLHIFSENEEVLSQIQGNSDIDDPRLEEYQAHVLDLFDEFAGCELRYPPSERLELTTRARRLAEKYCGAPQMPLWDIFSEDSPEVTVYQHRIDAYGEWCDFLYGPEDEATLS